MSSTSTNTVTSIGLSTNTVTARSLSVNRLRQTPTIRNIQRVIRNGKEYLVAPLTLIVPGVLNGSKGALFYPHDEISRTAPYWNGMPLVAYHPISSDGMHVSASEQGILDRQGVGFLSDPRVTTHTEHSKGKGVLTGKAWFDIEATKRVDPRILDSLQNGRPIEVSTGLYTDNEEAPYGSNYNGRPYSYVARNYRPDHLAILPDQVGACSINDGCGVLVNTNSCSIGSHNIVDHDTVDNTKQGVVQLEPSVIAQFWGWLTGNTYNCGGLGGKPGPCPTGMLLPASQPAIPTGISSSLHTDTTGLASRVIIAIKGKIVDKFNSMVERYGRTGAIATMAGVVAMSAIPLPGTSLVPIAVAEGVRAVHRMIRSSSTLPALAGNADIYNTLLANSTLDDMVNDAMKTLADIYKTAGEPMPAFDRALLGQTISNALESPPDLEELVSRISTQSPSSRVDSTTSGPKSTTTNTTTQNYTNGANFMDTTNAGLHQPRSQVSGKYKNLNAGTGKGDTHESAQRGAIHLSNTDVELGRDALQQLNNNPTQNPPTWAVDEDKWERAKTAANKGDYDKESGQYWAVVSHIYQNMGGKISGKSTTNSSTESGKDVIHNTPRKKSTPNKSDDGRDINELEGEEYTDKVAGYSQEDGQYSYNISNHTYLMSLCPPPIPVLQVNASKTQGDETLHPEDYAYVPDPDKPSTWKLRIDDAAHVGGAIAALGPGGFRGQKVEIPEEDVEKVKSKLRNAWLKAHPDKTEEDLPDTISSKRVDNSTHNLDDSTLNLESEGVTNMPRKRYECDDDDDDDENCEDNMNHNVNMTDNEFASDEQRKAFFGLLAGHQNRELKSSAAHALSEEANAKKSGMLHEDAATAHREAAKSHKESGDAHAAWHHEARASHHDKMADMYHERSTKVTKNRAMGEQIRRLLNNVAVGESRDFGSDAERKAAFAVMSEAGGSKSRSASAQSGHATRAERDSSKSSKEKGAAHEKAGNSHAVAAFHHESSGKTELADKHRTAAREHFAKADSYKVGTMNREAIIDHITSNCSCSSADRAALNTLSDTMLKRLYLNAKADGSNADVIDKSGYITAGRDDNDDEDEYDSDIEDEIDPNDDLGFRGRSRVTKGVNNSRNSGRPSMSEWLRKLPPEGESIWNSAVQIHQQEKSRLVAQLTANIGHKPTHQAMTQKLMSKSIEELKELATCLPPKTIQPMTPSSAERQVVNYLGAAVPLENTSYDGDKEDYLPLPTINYKEWLEEGN